jgi:hypothetical protein
MDRDVWRVALDDDGPFGIDTTMHVKWWMWPRWFHNNTGIGNSMDAWWPSRPGKHSAWVLCDRCGLPFEIPSGLSCAVGGHSDDDINQIEWRGGPCTRCKEQDGVIATGTPMLVRRVEGSVTVFGVSERVIDMTLESLEENSIVAVMMSLLGDLGDGNITVSDAANRLRSHGGLAARVGDWLESRPVTTAAAAAILTAIIAVAGPQLTATEQGDEGEEQISEIVDTVLDHYDELHQPQESAEEPNRRDHQPAQRPPDPWDD